MPIRTFLPALTLAAVLCAPMAQAGKIADFETALRAAYGSYRVALFDSNQGDAHATAEALNKFSAQWATLMSDWRSAPPPQYADDAKWADTLATVAKSLDAAKAAVKSDQIEEAHVKLEVVRMALWQLHLRNGIIGFSDRVNAYHAEMEKALALKAVDDKGKVAPEAIEMAGVLDYLATQIARNPAPEAQTDPDYGPLAAAFRKSAQDFAEAARSGDPDKVKAAIAALKPAYAKFFVKFG